MKAKIEDHFNIILPLLLTAAIFSFSLLTACAGGAPIDAPVVSPQPPETKPSDPLPGEEEAGKEAETETNAPNGAESSYVMPEEVYEETKKDLNKLVQELNEIIAKKDYQAWLSYLTPEYRAYYSDPEVLQKQSESPLLKKYSIVLRSLKDYFHYVVVGSRQNVRLDEIKALDENRVRAYMYINENPVIIYELQKNDGRWKIGIIE